jgi:hypothetical protein
MGSPDSSETPLRIPNIFSAFERRESSLHQIFIVAILNIITKDLIW